VEFSVRHRQNLPSGTVISNQAFVEFDFAGDLLQHPAPKERPWINTIDAGPPTSRVAELPAVTNQARLVVQWNGQDDTNGSGVAGYDVFVSDNNGPWTLWQNNSTNTSGLFPALSGHTYAFYSVARDNKPRRCRMPQLWCCCPNSESR